MNINVQDSNFNQITETIESIFKKARAGSPSSPPKVEKEQKIGSQAISREQSFSTKAIKRPKGFQKAKSGYRFSKRNNIDKIKIKNTSTSRDSLKSSFTGKKTKIGARKFKSSLKPKKSRYNQVKGFKRSQSNFSGNTFGNYLYQSKYRNNDLIEKKPNPSLKSRKPKYSYSSTSLGKRTFSKVLKRLNRIREGSLSSGKTSQSNSVNYNPNQFAGYFSKQQKALKKKSNKKSRPSVQKLTKFTKWTSKKYQSVSRKHGRQLSGLSSIGASSHSSFAGANHFSKKNKYDHFLKEDLEILKVNNFKEQTLNTQNGASDPRNISCGTVEKKLSKEPSKTQLHSREQLTEPNWQDPVSVSKRIAAPSHNVKLQPIMNDSESRLSTIVKKNKTKTVRKYPSFSQKKTKTTLSQGKSSPFKAIQKLLRSNAQFKGSAVHQFHKKNHSVSHKESSKMRKFIQNLSFGKFQKIGKLKSQTPAKKNVELVDLRERDSHINIGQNSSSGKVHSFEQAKIGKSRGQSPQNQSFGNRNDHKGKQRYPIIDIETDSKNKNLPLHGEESSKVSHEYLQNIDTNALETKHSELISIVEQENSNSRHSKKAEKGIYYELYIKQRDENMKLRKAVHALIKELDESNKRAEVTDFLFKIIYINFVLIFFKSRTNIPLDLQRAPS